MSEALKPVGELEDFSPKPFLSAALLLVQGDEPERALKVLENLPARYRDHIPREVRELKELIQVSLVTPHAYAFADMDSEVGSLEASSAQMDFLTRGKAVRDLVKRLNDEGKTPHIVEQGPGEYWLLLGLAHQGLKFTYSDITLLQRAREQAKEKLGPVDWWVGPRNEPVPIDTPYVYIAYEIIEHLFEPRELYIESLRHGLRPPDYVLLSTPCYTFDGSKDKDVFRRTGMPHLRAYTPSEFIGEANRIFPLYNWEIIYDQCMVLKGEKCGL